jgi:protein-S-isoprenylcysteine O-methyltransferase Ste14
MQEQRRGRTIADFRKDNGLALRKVCGRFVELCREMGLLATTSVTIDGARIPHHFFVFKENSYAASTIEIAEDQKIISTGPYALLRRPMYAGALPIIIGMPFALGSWWGLLLSFLFLPTLIRRLLDEERFLQRNLPGYTEYTHKVRYRLVPYVW